MSNLRNDNAAFFVAKKALKPLFDGNYSFYLFYCVDEGLCEACYTRKFGATLCMLIRLICMTFANLKVAVPTTCIHAIIID